MVSIIFLGVLGLLFLLLIVLTLVLIFTKKKDTDEDYGDTEDIYDEYEGDEDSYEEESDNQYYEASEDVSEYEEDEASDASEDSGDDEGDIFDEAYNEASDAQNNDDNETDTDTDEADIESEAEETETGGEVTDEDLDLDDLLDENSSTEEAATEDDTVTDNLNVEVDEIPAVFADELGDYSDSAFAPSYEDDKLSDEALIASVKEAQALSENVKNSTSNNNSEVLFGVGDELDKYKKKAPKKSTVSSDEDFYWYNKMDVMEKPSYKTAEMYYHYFNLPKDCIDDLLVEMYDCALVRTEEIRYIAYGIKPKAVSLKDIMQEGNYYYTDQPKQKEPLPQDLIRIYEKWCGYVDKLFDKIEIHADEYTIQEIRRILCEYGRNDVDVLLEGR